MSVALVRDSDVALAQRGDRDAFSRLVDGCRSVVCPITLAIVRDVPTSEDVAQEVFVAAFQSLDKLRNPASFLPWLRQLARNHAKELVRSRVRFGRRHAPWEDDATSAVDPSPHAGDAMIDREDKRALRRRGRRAARRIARDRDAVLPRGLLGETGGRSPRPPRGRGEKRPERARVAIRASLLERAAETLRKTAPGAGFTAGVIAAIALATPGTAAAASVGVSAASKYGGATATAAKVGGVLGGAAVGAASGLGAILYGSRQLWKKARDRRERVQIAWFTAVNVGAILFATVASNTPAGSVERSRSSTGPCSRS